MRVMLLYDNDLDGVISSHYYKKRTESLNPKIEIVENNEGDVLVSFDKGIDLLAEKYVDVLKRTQKTVVFDHHITNNYSLLTHNKHIFLLLDYTSPTTLDIVMRCYYPSKEFIMNFLKENRGLYRYLFKVEQEEFDKMNPKEISFYLNYFQLSNSIGDLPLDSKFQIIKDIFQSSKPISEKELEKAKVETISLVEEIEHFDNKYIFRAKENNILLYNIPFFFHDKEYLLLREGEERFFVSYRSNSERFFDYVIRNFDGGGRKLVGRERYIGGFKMPKSKLIDVLRKFYES